MKTTMVAQLLFTVASLSYVVSASLSETTEYYFCHEKTQTLKLDHPSTNTECEQTWAADSFPIGSFISGVVECHSPCINVTAGHIVISDCINVTLTVICSKEYVTEYRKHFLGIQSNPLPQQNVMKRGHYGIWACLSLLLLLVGGFIIQYCTCQGHNLRNLRPIQID